MIFKTNHDELDLERSVHSSLLHLAQKPLGIGAVIGSLMGIANHLILGISLLAAFSSGLFLGVAVWIVFCPGMRDELRARRELEASRRLSLTSRARITSAFTAFD